MSSLTPRRGSNYWIANIPAHWTIKRFKHIARASDERNGSKPVGQMLSVSGFRGIEVKRYDDENKLRSIEDLAEYRVVRKGQLVVNTMWLNYAGLGISEFDGYVSPAYRSYFIDPLINKRYLHHLLRSYAYVAEYTRLLQGIRPNSLQVSTENFGGIPIVLPPETEQAVIADFLDRETADADALVAKYERLVELLEEKRAALILDAIIRGLNPSVEMKDSHFELFRKIPETWDVLPAKRLLSFVTSGSRGWAEYYSDVGELFLRITNLTRTGIDLDLAEPKFVLPPFGAEGVRTKAESGDLLVSITADLGSVALIPDGLPTAYVSQHVALCRTIRGVHPRWLAYALFSQSSKKQFQQAGYGGTKVQLSLDDVKNIVIPVPSAPEQECIARWLDKRIEGLDALVFAAQKSISLIRERRSAVITAAVTGQIDVKTDRSKRQPVEAAAK